jgi:allantoinase
MKLIKNALIWSDNEQKLILQDIAFDEKIRILGKEIRNLKFESIINLERKLLLPGCIDAHVHFNDPGFDHHETFETGTRAAAAGGITTIIDMPCTSIPPVTSIENLKTKLSAIKKKALVDFALWGGIRGNDFPPPQDQVSQLWQAGVIGFKIYTISGMKTFAALDYDQIRSVFLQFPHCLFAFHAEDDKIIRRAIDKASPAESVLPENYLQSRPVAAENKAVKKIISSGKDNRLHFVHVSSENAAKFILKHKIKRDISWETCPHYLHFTAADFPRLKGRLKTAPPVKNPTDREFLRSCLKSGKIDFITTDHAGCDWESEKNLADFSRVYSGIPGIQFMIPYLFSEFYLQEKTPLSTMIDITSKRAAQRYGLYPRKGSLQVGSDADFTIIDLKKPMTVDEKSMYSIGKYSPFQGNTFACSVDRTIVRGETVFERDKGVTGLAGWGKWIRRR